MAGKTNSAQDLENPKTAWEPADIHPLGVLVTGFAVLFGGLLLTGLLWFYFEYLKDNAAAKSHALPRSVGVNPAPPEPRLKQNPAQDLAAYSASQQYLLHHYAWVDRQKGLVSIPIDRAMDIVSRRGLPAAAPAADMKLMTPAYGNPDTGLEKSVVQPEQ